MDKKTIVIVAIGTIVSIGTSMWIGKGRRRHIDKLINTMNDTLTVVDQLFQNDVDKAFEEIVEHFED